MPALNLNESKLFEARKGATGKSDYDSNSDYYITLKSEKIQKLSKYDEKELLNKLEGLIAIVNKVPSSYFEHRNKIVSLNIALNQIARPIPVLRPRVKTFPFSPHKEYPEWARAASNDKQLIDLDFVVQNFSGMLSCSLERASLIADNGEIDLDEAQAFIWNTGNIDDKLEHIQIPEEIQFYLFVLKTKKVIKKWKEIDVFARRYQSKITANMNMDGRSKITTEFVFKLAISVEIAKHCNAENLKPKHVLFHMNNLLTEDVPSSTKRRRINEYLTKCSEF